MHEKLNQLKQIMAEIHDLHGAISILAWDQETCMPHGAVETRGNQLATLSSLSHKMFTSPEMGQLLEVLKQEAASLDPDSDDARMIKVTAHDYDLATRVPPEFVAEISRVTTIAHEAWIKARSESHFPIFQPHLEKILELNDQFISFFPPADHPYDVLLDQYEPGMKTAEVKAIFDALRPRQVALIQAVAARPQVEDSFLHQHFPENVQMDFGTQVISSFGFDWNHGRQDKSVHPFTSGVCPFDVRLTTRVDEGFFNTMIFGTMHEAGHGMYDQGIPPAFYRTSLGSGASSAVHESQSRMWENLVGRSLPFWEAFYPRLQQVFSTQLGSVDLQTFYRGINRVAPSPIRVEADEATYNLHIMLRLEIEIEMTEGKIAVKDLPEIWNTKVQEYLGITPSDDAHGVLQDVHWSWGMLGYFSSYALGNLISLQLWEKMNVDIPDLADQVRQGKFQALLGWLRENVHSYGRKYEPQELVQKITDSKINPEPYMRYLKTKFSEIYGL